MYALIFKKISLVFPPPPGSDCLARWFRHPTSQTCTLHPALSEICPGAEGPAHAWIHASPVSHVYFFRMSCQGGKRDRCCTSLMLTHCCKLCKCKRYILPIPRFQVKCFVKQARLFYGYYWLVCKEL